jgi:hypothetical protein
MKRALKNPRAVHTTCMQQMHQETVSRSGAGLELHQPKKYEWNKCTQKLGASNTELIIL